MKTSKAFQIWTQCVENKWGRNGVPLAGRNLIVSIQRATELHYTFCVIWVTMFKTQQLIPYKR